MSNSVEYRSSLEMYIMVGLGVNSFHDALLRAREDDTAIITDEIVRR